MIAKIRNWFGGYGAFARIVAIGLLAYFLVWDTRGRDEQAYGVVAFIFFSWACMPIRRFKPNPLREIMEPTCGMIENEDYLIGRPVVCIIFGIASLLASQDQDLKIAAAFVFAAGFFCAGTRFDDRQCLRRRFLERLALDAAPSSNRAELGKSIRAVYEHLGKPSAEQPKPLQHVMQGASLEAKCHELLKTHTT